MCTTDLYFLELRGSVPSFIYEVLLEIESRGSLSNKKVYIGIRLEESANKTRLDGGGKFWNSRVVDDVGAYDGTLFDRNPVDGAHARVYRGSVRRLCLGIRR